MAESSLSTEVSSTTVLPTASNLSGSSSTGPNPSVSDVDTGFITARTSTGRQSIDPGFQPDLVLLTATNTVSSTGSEQSITADYGWCHGAADLNSEEQYAVFSGTGSQSTNGMGIETDNSRALNILELADDGDTIQNRIQATVDGTVDGFDLNYSSVGESEQIQYQAYAFTDTGGADIGIATARTSTGVQSISTSIAPDFVKFIGQPRATSASQTVQDGNDWGLSHGWLTSSTQYSLAFASYSNNVDDHVYGSRNSSCFLVKHAGSKGGTTGTTEATGTLTSSGFDLDYTSVDGVGEAFLYVALKVDEGVTVAQTNAPETATTVSVNGSFRTVNVTGNATIDGMNTDGYSGSNQNAITYGWSHGRGNSTSSQSVLSVGVSSDSVNAHRYYGASSETVRLLFTDANGNNDGSEDATWSATSSSDITLDFTSAVASGDSGVASSHATNPLIVWGLNTIDSAPEGDIINISWTNNDDSPDGGIDIERSTDGFSTITNIISSIPVTTTSYDDTSVNNGVTYEYRVQRNTDHKSVTSNSITVATTLPVTVNGQKVSKIVINGEEVTGIEVNGSQIF